MRYSRDTLDRWIRRYRAGGFAELSPPRGRVCCAPIPRCWRWLPHSSGNLRTATGWAPSESTLLRLFRRCELIGPTAGDIGGEVFGRFEAETPTTAGPGTPCMALGSAGGKPICSPSSMIIPGCSAATDSGSPRTPSASAPRCNPRWPPAGPGQRVCRQRISLRRQLAATGVRETRNPAGSFDPAPTPGRGKIERFFRTVREQFCVEIVDTSAEELTDAGTDHRALCWN